MERISASSKKLQNQMAIEWNDVAREKQEQAAKAEQKLRLQEALVRLEQKVFSGIEDIDF